MCDVSAAADGDEVDVLAQPPVREVSAGQGGAADEVDSVTEVAAEEGQQLGDEVVALDLLGGNAELCCYRFAFVRIHGRSGPSPRRDAGTPAGAPPLRVRVGLAGSFL